MNDSFVATRGFYLSSWSRHFAFVTASVATLGASVAWSAPEITSVHGCPVGSTGVEQCPTAGNIPITIVGTAFGLADAHAFVGGRDCPVTSLEDTEIVCTLPPGSGKSVVLHLRDAAGSSSSPAALLSYSPPEITSVAGCTTDPTGNATECAKSGGNVITINGNSFGPSGSSKTVLIGGEVCPSSADDDDSIECTLPPGSGTDKRVLVVSANYLSVGATYSLSYHQCPPGTVAGSDGSCTPCAAGEFAPYRDNPECYICPSSTDSGEGSADCKGASNYQCWQAKDISATKFVPVEDQTVSDHIAPAGTVDLKKPVMYCTAADLDATGLPLPQVHQCCYQVKGTKLGVPVALATDDQGASRTLKITQPKMVCMECQADHL